MEETAVLYNPYNPINKYLEKDFLEGILGFKIHHLDVYQRAFVHKSYCKGIESYTTNQDGEKIEFIEKPSDCIELQEHSNERLEFLGDSILGASVTSYLYRRYDKDEGFCTKLKTKMINTDTLAKLSTKLGLGEYLMVNKHVEEKCGGRTNPRILEDLFESLIGAIYLDFNRYELNLESKGFYSGLGYQVAERFIIDIMEKYIDFTELIKNDHNYKDIILRYYQKNYHVTPKYIKINVVGPPTERYFTMGIQSPDGKVIGIGKATHKKKAEQLASREAMKYYGILEESSDSEMTDSDEE